MSEYLSIGQIYKGSEAFFISEKFNQFNESILYIARDDREIFDIQLKLNWLLPNTELLIFRSWDQIPYDNVSPSKEIQSERIRTLYDLTTIEKKRIIITSVNAILQKTVNPKFVKDNFIEIYINKKFDFNNLVNQLTLLGYQRTSVVREKTEFAVRGSIIDIFLIDRNFPIRLDFFDNNLENIYEFDRLTQQRINQIKEKKIYIHISSELILNENSLSLYRKKFRKLFNNYRLSQAYNLFSESIIPPGGEQFLPLFLKKMETLFLYIEKKSRIYLNSQFHELLEFRLENINDFYNARKNSDENYYLKPEYLYLNNNDIKSNFKNFKIFKLNEFIDYKSENFKLKKVYNLSSSRKEIDFNFIKKFFNIQGKDKNVIICCRSKGSLERVMKFLKENIQLIFIEIKNFKEIDDNNKCIYITVLNLENSFELQNFIFVNEKTIFGYNFSTREKSIKNKEIFFEEINKFTKNSILVHSEYGLCRFINIKKLDINESSHDCVELDFADNQKLFLPVENLNYITKYSNDDDHNINLDKLGTVYWQRRKAEAKNKIKDAAKKLISIAAKRLNSTSYPIYCDPIEYDKFCSTFPFVETDDQLNAIDDVVSDFKKNNPSDRLIVGDVAFGKTEVILRAIFMVAKSNLQSIVIVPTTLLSKQHYENFSKRLILFGISVKQVSRLVDKKERLQVLKSLKEGTTQVIIGTHSLLNDKIEFNKLGLIIYDEEQKFGTLQKEKLKNLAPKAHVISLSATPIPRTLSMSLSGIRDLSLILTAPYERLAVRSFISPFDELTIIEAIKREILGRKNGVYFVTPRKRDILFLEKFVKENLPDIKFVVAHGQLEPKTLKRRISQFYNREVSLMISTNIIENGLDLPHVNTIIVYRSNMFSLSSIYQLKGRVGRSTKRGYAYLTYNEKELTNNARKRLSIINSFDQLGSGFNITSQDLELRGGGSIIGEEQSGFIREIGTELYHQMLEEEIFKQKNIINNENVVFFNKFSFQPTIKIPEKIYIPEDYIDDLDLRISIYKRISKIENLKESKQFMFELTDRFGSLPNEIDNLFKLIEIKILCLNNNIEKIEFGKKGVLFSFYKNNPPNPNKLLSDQFLNKSDFTIRPDQKVFYDFQGSLNEERFKLTKNLIREIT